MNTRVLILGSTGFVGRNLCEHFRESSIEYLEASRSTGIDLRDVEQCAELLSKTKPEIVVNCAAHVGSLNYVTEQAAEVMLDNSRMILSFYEATAKTRSQAVIVNPIANCAYPGKAETYIEDEWWNGPLHRSVLSYGSTRRFLWTVGESFDMQYRIRSIYLLVPNMYGPYDSTDPNKAHALDALVSKFVKAQRMGQQTIDIWGTGIAIREWLYAKDFARIVAEIVRDPSKIGLSEPINIAQNFGLSVRELVNIIQSLFNYSGTIRYDSSKPDGALKKVMDDRKFRKIFPDFKFTDFTEGIKRTIDYYMSQYPY